MKLDHHRFVLRSDRANDDRTSVPEFPSTYILLRIRTNREARQIFFHDRWIGDYARAAVEHLSFDTATAVNRTDLDVRGYVGLPGQSILVLRGQRQGADTPLPPYLKALLGGMSNLRGFRAGSAVGDTLVAGSLEIRTPLTSPLKFAKFGANAFVDLATVYDTGAHLGDQAFEQGVGAGVWFSAAFFRMSLVVAHGIGAGTRVHLGTTLSF